MNNIKIYVINLKRRTDRLEKFYKNFEDFSFDKEKIEVVYGFDAKNAENESYIEKTIFNNLPNNLTKGEKGVFISNIRIYKDIIDKNITFAIIMEDDAYFCKDFKTKLDKVINEMPLNTEILYFGGRFYADFRMQEGTFIQISDNIVQHDYSAGWNAINHDRCNYGYIISNSFAKCLVQAFEKNINVNYAVDDFIVRTCRNHNTLIYNSCPLLVHGDAYSIESDIRQSNY